MGAMDEALHQRLVIGVQAQLLQIQASGLFVQQTHHHPLAVGGGHGGDAYIHGAAGDAQGDATILGQALLGNIEACHHLDTRGDQRCQHPLGAQHFAHDTVDAQAHHHMTLVGLDMDIRGALLNGLGEQGIDETNNGGIVLALQQILGFGQGVGEAIEIEVAIEPLHGLHGLAGALFVVLLQAALEGLGIHPLQGQGAAQVAAHLDQGLGLQAGSAEDQGMAVVKTIQQHLMAFGEGEGDAQGLRRLVGHLARRRVGQLLAHESPLSSALEVASGAEWKGSGMGTSSSKGGRMGATSSDISPMPFSCT